MAMLGNPLERTAGPFERPVLNPRVDVDAHLRACPPTATTRGTFFQFLVDVVHDKRHRADIFDGVGSRRWVPWNNYPLIDFMRMAINVVRILHRERAVGEGLRSIGRMAYPSFANTMAGRVILHAFGDDIDAMMLAVPRAYAVSVSHLKVTSTRLGPRHWQVQMRDVFNFVETYHLGVLEGALLARGVTPNMQIRRHARPCDLDFDVQW
jgi:uncharacterized protein (TIGR02265 family)